MKLFFIVAAFIILSISCFSQAKKDTAKKVIQLPAVDSVHLIWPFEALNKGQTAWEDRQDISAKDASERKLYTANLLQFLGQEYQRVFYIPPKPIDSAKKK